MPTKGEKTKLMILAASTKVFAEKGYSKVTMTDICKACDMSRGGLYRHYSSTKEIFIAILEKDINQNIIAVKENIKRKVPADVILDYYFQHEAEAILNVDNGIFFAIHEFAFLEHDQREYINNRLQMSVELLSLLFEYGQHTKVFKAFDIEVVTTHILYFFDSLKTLAPIFTPDKVMIEKQISLIKELII